MHTSSVPKYVVRKDRILFVDNELTCWASTPPPGEFPEIIEIGIAELDIESLEVTRSRSFLVRPQFSTVSDYCTELTGHTAESLKRDGRPLGEVLRTLGKEFGAGSKAWYAWGHDRQSIERDAELKRAASPFSAAFFDMGLHFSLTVGAGRAVGLTEAMRLCGLDRGGRIHSGVDDAVQTAVLWARQAQISRELLLAPPHEEDSQDAELFSPKP